MNTTQLNGIMQRWRMVQHELMPALQSEAGVMTPKLEQVIHTLEWVRIEEFVRSTWNGCGRPELDNIVKDWKMPPRTWKEAANQFAIIFGERFTVALN